MNDNSILESPIPEEKDKLWQLYILLGVIVVIWFITFLSIHFWLPKWKEIGIFGDAFGSINSLFSGLAFAGIIYTILLQRKELKLQREELAETRKELKRSAAAQEKSEEALRRQAENLKVTAKLNALNTLVNYYGNLLETYEGQFLVNKPAIEKERDGYISQIKEILQNKNREDGLSL